MQAPEQSTTARGLPVLPGVYENWNRTVMAAFPGAGRGFLSHKQGEHLRPRWRSHGGQGRRERAGGGGCRVTWDPWVGYSRRGCLGGNRDLQVVRWRSHLILQDPVPPRFTKGTCVLTAEGREATPPAEILCDAGSRVCPRLPGPFSLSFSESAPEMLFPKPQLPRT